jgi:hypothetical protein
MRECGCPLRLDLAPSTSDPAAVTSQVTFGRMRHRGLEKPEFHDWLKLQDTFSDAIRHELLTAAYERNDIPRVLAFFNGFLAQEAARSRNSRYAGILLKMARSRSKP